MHQTLNPDQNISSARSKWHQYSLYGLTLASDFSFETPLISSVGEPDLTFTLTSTSPMLEEWKHSTPAYTSSLTTDDGEASLYLYRQSTYDVLHFTDTADFYIWSNKIICHPLAPVDSWIEINLLGSVFSFWLERQGIPTLHASAVVVDSGAAVFMAQSKSGKSSLAASFIQAGYPLLTDDILPIEYSSQQFLGRPGYAQMRLWPNQARNFLGNYQHLERILPEFSKRRIPLGVDGWGGFCDSPQSITCFYLPERRNPQKWGEEIVITPVSPRDATIELARHSFANAILPAMDLQPQRFNFLVQLAQHIPMRRLVYPSGFQYLPRVREAILTDCGKIQRHSQP